MSNFQPRKIKMKRDDLHSDSEEVHGGSMISAIPLTHHQHQGRK